MATPLYGLLLGAAVLLLLVLLLRPAWLQRRYERLRQQPVPSDWEAPLRAHVWLYEYLPDEVRAALLGQMQVFLAGRRFIGCNGLEITPDMRLSVAAWACLLRLGTRGDPYPDLRSILIYPGPFLVDKEHMDEAGVVSEAREVLIGESWEEGRVILSWSDVLGSAAEPHSEGNVIVHEFCHQLDQLDGVISGAPPLPDAESYERWSSVFEAEYDRLVRYGAEGVLDSYATSAPEEFFAVAVEAFFDHPWALEAEHPRLYKLLAAYFRLDLAAWISHPARREPRRRASVH